MSYAQEYAEMFSQKSRRFILLNGGLFTRQQHWIAPQGPVIQGYNLSHQQCHDMLRELGGLWVMWTDGFESNASGAQWYAVICRKHIRIEDVSSGNTRNQIRKGLKNCEVRKVDAEEIAKHGYETYCAALRGYRKRSVPIPTHEEFQCRERMDAPFSDIRHQWAVYHDGRMIAFTHNLIYDKTEVDYTLIKLHPDYLKFYPAYALIYRMNEHYLGQEGFEYVNDGFRSISHDTGIQEFLIKKFGFEKAYMNLHVYYRPPLGLILKMARPFRGVFSKVYPKADALFELDRLRCDSPNV